RNGQFDIDKPEPTPTYSPVKLDPSFIYSIRIEARGNKIDTYITSQSDPNPKIKGREFPLGTFVHEDKRYFNYGGVGFRTIDGEEVMIQDLHVLPVAGAEEKKTTASKYSGFNLYATTNYSKILDFFHCNRSH